MIVKHFMTPRRWKEIKEMLYVFTHAWLNNKRFQTTLLILFYDQIDQHTT